MVEFKVERFDDLLKFGYQYFGMYPIVSLDELNELHNTFPNSEFYLLHPNDTESFVELNDLKENFNQYLVNGLKPAMQLADAFPEINENYWFDRQIVEETLLNYNKKLSEPIKDLRDIIRENTNKTLTDNLDAAYKTTFDANLDFFASASSLRQYGFKNYKYLDELLTMAAMEDINLAIKNVFFLRDVRNGNKERDLGRYALTFIANNYPEEFSKILRFIPKIGRFDDLTYILSTTKNYEVKKQIAFSIWKQLEIDNKSDTPSLLAKWLPTTDAGKKTKSRAYDLTKVLKEEFDVNPFAYHRMVKNIRKKLDLVETKITKENFKAIDYEKVPGQAMLKNYNLFLRKDETHFEEYLDSLNKGEIKAKTTTMTPVELVKRAYSEMNFEFWNDKPSSYYKTSEALNFINNQWRNLKRIESDKNMIVVRDGSGSMIGQPMDVATSLAIYASECLTGKFKNSFITFSRFPELIEIPDKLTTLSEKLVYVNQYDDMFNTNIKKVYQLILESSIGLPESEQLDTVVIVSDMEFDNISYDSDESTYKYFENQFKKNNVKFPHVVFWNVDVKNLHFPATKNDNVSLVSGYSTEILKEIINNEVKSPIERMLTTLNRYDYLDKYLIND